MSLEFTQILTLVGGTILMGIAERKRLMRYLRWVGRRLAPTSLRAPVSGVVPSDPGQLVNQYGLTLACWSMLLNDQRDQAPHVLLVGPSGAGKTTFTRALLAHRTGQVLVLTPKPDDDWGGAPVVTIDDDGSFTTMATACAALNAEVRRRLVAGKRRLPVGEALTIVCDDFPVIISEVGRPAAALFKLVGRLGRSLQVRLIVLSQSERVKALGLSGEGDATDNYLRLDLARGHRATLQWEGYALQLDTRDVPALAAYPFAGERGWTLDLSSISALGHGNEREHLVLADGNAANEVVTASEQVVSGLLPGTVTTREAAQIAHLLASLPPSEVIKRLDGYSPRRYSEFKAKVDVVRGILTNRSD